MSQFNAAGVQPVNTVTQDHHNALSRTLSPRDTVLITLSAITPASSVFVIVPTLLLAVGGSSVMVMLGALCLCVGVAFCYAELAARYPIAGGEYAWAARLLGKTTGFAVFVMTLLSGIAIIALVALGTGDYLSVAFPALHGKWIGVCVIVGTTLCALGNIRANAWLTGLFLVVEVVAIAVLSIVGFADPSRGVGEFVRATTAVGDGVGPVGVVACIGIVPVALFAYNGYGSAVYYAEETRDADRVIGRIVLYCLVATALIEIIPLAAVVIGAPSMSELLHSPLPMNYLLESRAGHAVNVAVSVGIAIAIINAVIALNLQISRMLFASARDRSWTPAIDRLLGSTSKRTFAPVWATIVVGAAASAAASLIPSQWLITSTGVTVGLLYLAVAAAALRVRRVPCARGRTYKMPWWPVPPLVVIGMMGYVLAESLRTDWKPVAVAAGLLLVGALYFTIALRPRLGARWSLPDPLGELGAVVPDPDVELGGVTR